MKKIVSAILVSSVLLGSLNAFASGNIVFKGKIENKKLGRNLTVMTLKTGADEINPAFSDIGWINQYRISDDGSYNVSVPMSQFTSEYYMKSNIGLVQQIYVSEKNGTSDGSGEEASPVNTISKALEIANDNSIIILTDTVTIAKNTQLKSDCKNITITGKNPSTGKICGGMDLTNTVSMHIKFSATLENMTLTTLATEYISENANKIFACGYDVVFGEGLSMTNPIDVFGGNSVNNTCESTNVVIKSGDYRRIFGGGENSPVTGDTHITIYGMNMDFSANDDSSNYYDSRILGGGKNPNSDVAGSTYINFNGGTASYIVGGGSASSVGKDTHIKISGGRVMNVYGGVADKTTVHNGNAYIEMTGGIAESIFGGSLSCNFNGNTHIVASGGEILRRIYAGCYNDFDGSYSTSYYVNGTTSVLVGPDVKIATGGDLSWANKLNSGIFGSSRIEKNIDAEDSVIIFNRGSYDIHGVNLGEVGEMYQSSLLSHHDTVIKAGVDGDVYSVNGRNIKIVPDKGKVGVIDGKKTFKEEHNISLSEAIITFENGFTVDKNDFSHFDDGAKVGANVTVGDEADITGKEQLMAVAYGLSGKILSVGKADITQNGDYEINLNFDSKESSYKIKLLVWNTQSLKPLGADCVFTIGG